MSPHPCFTRKGKNLELRVPLTVSEAALGTKVEVPSPHGAITLTIPSGTSSGARLRMKGHGVKGNGKEPGDLLAEVQIAVGDSSATDAKAAYEQLAGLPNEAKEREQLRAKLVW